MISYASTVVSLAILQGIANLREVQPQNHNYNLNLQKVNQLLTNQLGRITSARRLVSRLLPLRIVTSLTPKTESLMRNSQKTNKESNGYTPSRLIGSNPLSEVPT
jgi:hypothetical protein